MCVDVDEVWEMLWSDSAAIGDERATCYECGRSLTGEVHTHGHWGPLAYRECQIEDCDHLDCNDGEEYIDEAEGCTMRFCPQCLAARVWLEKVCHSWMYGGIIEDLEMHFIDEMRPICSLPLGRIVVASKKRWKRRDGSLWPAETVKGWADQGAEMVLTAIGMPDCPWCGEPLRPADDSDGRCVNGHEWWDDDGAGGPMTDKWVPDEVVLDHHGRQVLAVIDDEVPEMAGKPFRRYIPCSEGCGYLIGCGDAIESVAHLSCARRGRVEP